MKNIYIKSICVLFFSFCFHFAFAQKETLIDSLTKGMNDFSNDKNSKHVNLINALNAKQLASTIVIIDSKIYKINSKEVQEFNEKDIVSLHIIKDERSETDIKNIIIISTVKKDESGSIH